MPCEKNAVKCFTKDMQKAMMAAQQKTGAREMKPRHNWTPNEIEALFALPFSELLFRAHSTHREHFDPNRIQLCQLLSIKTGGCPEDCGYCSQSVHAKTPIKASKLMEVETVLAEAKKAKAKGATRYCMGAAWRNPKDRDMEKLEAMIKGVNKLGLE
ncbi:MAG: biotin synthase BioB, partial [Parvibaculales bacterium]